MTDLRVAMGQLVQVISDDDGIRATDADVSAGTDSKKWVTSAQVRSAIDGYGGSQFATAAQGAKADTALQPADIGVSVQAYDADLTAWAGVNPSSYSTTAEIAAAYQPLDADLTALAAAGNSAVLAATTASFTTTDETKLDGIEVGADVTDATNVAAAGAVMESDTSTALMSFVVDEDDMASDSATKVPTQQSVKAYVDANAGADIPGVHYVTSAPYNATGDGVTDDATACQAALTAAAGGGVVIFPGDSGQTYLIGTGLDIGDHTTVIVEAGATVKLANGVNDKLFSNADTVSGNTGIHVKGPGTIDGNKANQTAGSSSRGVYLVQVTDSSVSDGLIVQNFECHGIHFSLSSTKKGNWIGKVITRNNGLNASSIGGSGVAITDGMDFTISDVQSYGNYRVGIRPSGDNITINSGVYSENGQGGIVPVASNTRNLIVNGPICRDNTGDVSADGIRLVDIDRVVLNGPICEGNDGSGIMCLNGTQNVQINSPICRNNGKNATARSTTTGRDGITVKNSTTACSGITITSPQCFDDQGTATQDYGIAIEDSAANVTVSTDAYLVGNQTAAILNTSTAKTNSVRSGWRVIAQSAVQASHTGDTNETTLATVTVPANAMGPNGSVRITTYWTTTNSANNKTMRIRFGGTGGTIYQNLVVTTTTHHRYSTEIHNRNAANSQVGVPNGFASGMWGSAGTGTIGTSAVDTTADVDIVFRATLANTGETIALEYYLVEVAYKP